MAAFYPTPTVVVATRNRSVELCCTLERLLSMTSSSICVVDNASDDDTSRRARRMSPRVEVVSLPVNEGAAARNVGVGRARTPCVAFADDDSWWAPGALERAAEQMRAHPMLGLVAAKILVGPEQRVDPVCEDMARSPLPRLPGTPGVPILGFLACGAVVRRDAFLGVGGFERRFGVGGEEELLALDLATSGWRLAYDESIVAHHHPSSSRSPERRRRVMTRNALWTTWLRRRGRGLLAATSSILREALTDRAARRGVGDALGAFGWALRERRPLPIEVERARRLLG